MANITYRILAIIVTSAVVNLPIFAAPAPNRVQGGGEFSNNGGTDIHHIQEQDAASLNKNVTDSLITSSGMPSFGIIQHNKNTIRYKMRVG